MSGILTMNPLLHFFVFNKGKTAIFQKCNPSGNGNHSYPEVNAHEMKRH